MTSAAVQQYRNTQVSTASQGMLIVMLYDGLLRFVARAEQAMERGDVEAAHNALTRAHDILTELLVTLNPAAGELTANLSRLYEFMGHCIVQANVRKDAGPLRTVARIASELRSAWAEAAKAANAAVAGGAQSQGR